MTEIMGFNIFDVVVIGLILLLSLKGLFSGFTKEFFNSLGLIGGIFVASYFYKSVANYIFNNLTDAISIKILNLLSLILIFVIFFFVIKLIGKAFAMIASDDYISAASRLGGMIVKMITLFFIFSLITYAVSSKENVIAKFKDTLNSSKLYPLLRDTGAYILNMPIISNASNTNNEQNSTISKVKVTTTNESNMTAVKETNVSIQNSNLEKNATKTETNSTQN